MEEILKLNTIAVYDKLRGVETLHLLASVVFKVKRAPCLHKPSGLVCIDKHSKINSAVHPVV